MNNITPDRLERLPGWAKDHIRDLELQVAASAAALDAANAGPLPERATTPIMRSAYIPGTGRVYYEVPGDRVLFSLGEGSGPLDELELEIVNEGDCIAVRSNTGALIIRPAAGNVVRLSVAEWSEWTPGEKRARA